MYRLVFCASEVKTLYHTINFVETYGFCALSSAFCESNSIIENVFLYLYMYFFFYRQCRNTNYLGQNDFP